VGDVRGVLFLDPFSISGRISRFFFLEKYDDIWPFFHFFPKKSFVELALLFLFWSTSGKNLPQKMVVFIKYPTD
jgi:hypothetical protein